MTITTLIEALGIDDPAALLALPIGEQPKALEKRVRALSEDAMRQVARVVAAEYGRAFLPFPGPQTEALLSQADVLLYGGAAGGGKSHLLVGAAGDHKRAGIFRRESTELDGLIAVLHELYGRDGYHKSGNGGEMVRNHQVIRLGGMKEPDDWKHFAGRARDFLGFDEAGEFLEGQVRSIMAWLRSPDEEQRCRVILASNPPRSAEGEWMVRWFAPWIDPSFPDPAVPGELRYAIWVDDELRWVNNPEPILIDDETYTPLSYTFIPARLADNPFQDQAGYRARLQNLPEPLRSQLIHGNFLAGREDDAWQVIPSAWITAAQARWKEDGGQGIPMTSIGVDVAQGGPDNTVLAPRRGRWFAPVKVHKGIDTKDGPTVAGLVVVEMRDGCTVAIDTSGGWGGSAYDHLRGNSNISEDAVIGVVFGSGSTGRTQDGLLEFLNKRAELYWRFREALDPENEFNVALPPDPALAAELAMPRYRMRGPVIQVEAKEDIIKRLKRSPDRADAVVVAWAYGDERAANRGRPQTMQTQANLGYAHAKLRAIPGGRDGGGQTQTYQSSYRRRA